MKIRMSVVMLSMVTPLFMLPLASAQTAMGPQPFTADATYSGAGHGSRAATEMQGKMYFGRNHMRMEMQAGEHGGSVIISDFKTKVTDILMPEQQMYFEHRGDDNSMRRPGMAATLKPFADPSNPCANDEGATCKNLGTEQMNGRACDHWQITDKNGKVTNAWVDNKIHFPIKSVTPDGTWELSNIKEGEPDASLFQIPPGYHKMDMGNMMQGGRPPQQ